MADAVTPLSNSHASLSYPLTPVVTLHVWGVDWSAVPGSVLRMGSLRRSIRGADGCRFAKLLGTGDARTFTARDADPRHWAVLASWSDAAAAAAFDHHPAVRSWDRASAERAVFTLLPIASTGTWSGQQPFSPAASRGERGAARNWKGPVAALTRARIKPSHWRGFWRAVPPVSAALWKQPGLLLATGIGEAPLGLQGTFSMWESNAAIRAFATGDPAHARVIARTAEVGWYAEELFARFAVLAAEGTFAGRDVRASPAQQIE